MLLAFRSHSSLGTRRFVPDSRAFLVLLLLLAAALPVHAQGLLFGRVEGRITGAENHSVSLAEVRLDDVATGASRWQTTARDGTFRFDGVPSGRYVVFAEALGFRPVVQVVEVEVGRTARVTIALREAPAPVVAVDTVPALRRGQTALSWITTRGLGELSGLRRSAADLAAWAPRADAVAVEGLPWRFGVTLVDGAVLPAMGAPLGPGRDILAAVSVAEIADAEIGGLGSDVEIGGSGIGVRATTRRGLGASAAAARLESGAAGDGASLAAAAGLQRERATGIVAVDGQRASRDAWAAGGPTRADARASGFGRMDWHVGERSHVIATLAATQWETRRLTDAEGADAWIASRQRQTSAQAGVTLLTRLGPKVWQEWRLATAVADAWAPAGLVDRIVAGDTPARLAGSFDERRTAPSVTGLLHLELGAHRVKLGGIAATHTIGTAFVRGAEGVYWLDDVPVTSAEGTWRRVEPPLAPGDFTLRETAAFLQDAWTPVSGLTVTMGVRVETAALPIGRIARNAAWAEASGLDNTAVRNRVTRSAPRLSLRWDLGADRAWTLQGDAAVYHALPDSRDVGEALMLAAGADVRSGAGVIGWPGTTAPLDQAPVVGRTLTLLAPGFRGPRTQRVAVALSRAVGDWRISLEGVQRLTDGLARRLELNRSILTVGEDQYGRPLYGSLVQYGAVLAAVPGSNRRFVGFDAVHGLESAARSEYRGATVTVLRDRARGLSLLGAYTFSRTEDDVALLAPLSLSPFPDGWQGRDWMNGRSDLDVPHRGLVAAEWQFGVWPVAVGAVYRVRSGLPFTPSVRAGVDANADGDFSNDPAFVDTALAGMAAMVATHGCLAVGRFATRNGCRLPIAQALDLRATLRLPRLRVGQVTVALEAVDLLTASAAPVDRALLLVDRTATLSVNGVTGVTTVPYVVNPRFAKAMDARTRGVLWRLGVRVEP